jgi:hypothetical protein
MASSRKGYSSPLSPQMVCIIFKELKLLFKDVFLGKPRLAISSNGAYCSWGIIKVVP